MTYQDDISNSGDPLDQLASIIAHEAPRALPPFPIRAAGMTYSMPLDTAAWNSFFPAYKEGDFWLGRSLDGKAVGVDDDQHVLLNASARGGKGVSYIVPNICLHPGSCVVVDPKGENAIVTARRRADGSVFAKGMGQKVRILDPFNVVQRDDDDFSDLKASFNPLDLINEERPESVDDAARLAEAIIISESKGEEFWDDAARAFLKAIILHVATAPEYEDE